MLTRRQFLAGAATVIATVTGCTLRRPGRQDQVPAPDLPLPPAAEEGPRPFRIALLSDPHTQEANATAAGAINGKLARAVDDFKALKPDIWLCNGDVSDHGLPGEFDAFKAIFKKVAKPEQLIVTTGNSEFYDRDASDEVALARFREAFSLERPYSSHVVGGIHIVMLADEQWKTAPKFPEWAWLSEEQVRWFERVLGEHKEKFTVVCLHQPLQDTVVWSHGGNDFAGSGQEPQLRAILKQNPQVKLWLSGHTHQLLEAQGNQVVQGGVHFVALGSTFYMFVPPTAEDEQNGVPLIGGFKRDLGASQSRLMEVWPDHVVVKARDHAKQIWLDDLEIKIDR